LLTCTTVGAPSTGNGTVVSARACVACGDSSSSDSEDIGPPQQQPTTCPAKADHNTRAECRQRLGIRRHRLLITCTPVLPGARSVIASLISPNAGRPPWGRR